MTFMRVCLGEARVDPLRRALAQPAITEGSRARNRLICVRGDVGKSPPEDEDPRPRLCFLGRKDLIFFSQGMCSSR